MHMLKVTLFNSLLAGQLFMLLLLTADFLKNKLFKRKNPYTIRVSNGSYPYQELGSNCLPRLSDGKGCG